jgi:septal ring factor EnvC (AmiA/AmiB activator)
MLKKITFIVLALFLVSFSSCLSKNKYKKFETEHKSTQTKVKENEKILMNLQIQSEKLLKETKNLLKAIKGLKAEMKKENFIVQQAESKNSKSDTLTNETSRPYTIWLSSCQRQESVQKVLAKYKKINLKPYTVKVDLGENGIWWRIYAGHYESREEAIKEKNKYGLTNKIVLRAPRSDYSDTYDHENEEENKKTFINAENNEGLPDLQIATQKEHQAAGELLPENH